MLPSAAVRVIVPSALRWKNCGAPVVYEGASF
jgi:hypothetical protein